MKNLKILILVLFMMSFNVFAMQNVQQKAGVDSQSPVWANGTNVDKFWEAYINSKGGLTWSASDTYPDYSKVKEGDTFLVELKQGPCLMEFFHGRWRRANDVRRWDDSVNEYAGCPYVFD